MRARSPRWVVYAIESEAALAEAVIIGPYRSEARAEAAAERLYRRHDGHVATTVLPLTQQADLMDSFG